MVSATGTCCNGSADNDDDSSTGMSNGTYEHVSTAITYRTDNRCAIFIGRVSGEQDMDVEDDRGTIQVGAMNRIVCLSH